MAKSLEDKLSQVVEDGDSLVIDLARQDLEHEASKCCKGYTVRSRLKRVPNKAVICNVLAHEEVRRCPSWYSESVKSLNRCILRLNHKMRKAFQAHFQDHFACYPDLPVQQFHSYLANFLHLWEAEAVSRNGVITECEVHDVLKKT